MGRMNVCVKMVNGLGQNSSFVLLVVSFLFLFHFVRNSERTANPIWFSNPFRCMLCPQKHFVAARACFLNSVPGPYLHILLSLVVVLVSLLVPRRSDSVSGTEKENIMHNQRGNFANIYLQTL